MTKHLMSCQASSAPNSSKTTTSTHPIRYYHLLVQSRYHSQYWLHLAARANATLTNLDSFLRDIWLECCGHLSQFEINGANHFSAEARELGGRGMRVALDKVLRPNLKFFYDYDFGSTTRLTITVQGELLRPRVLRSPVELLARNHPPAIQCVNCGDAATKICTECVYEDGGSLCDSCANEHECEDDMFLPVVNSPRAGVCDYVG